MRITTVSWASRLSISHLFSLGLVTPTRRSIDIAKALFVLALLIIWQSAYAQPTDFCIQCTGTTGNCAFPANAANPDLTSLCTEMDIVFILDESGSVQGYEGDVEAGVMAFLTALNGTGARVSVIEFNALARTVNNYVAVNGTYITSMQGYFDGIPY